MGDAPPKAWSLAAFLDWESQQAERYEFVDHQAVMMAGGTQAHGLITSNLIALLRPLLRGSGCRPMGPDMRVPTPGTGNSRYPDVTIDCGKFDGPSRDASEPSVIFEVLSKSTGWYDQTQKVKDYASVSTIRQYVCISQSEPRISVWLRDEDGRLVQLDDLVERDAALSIVGFQEPMRLVEIYEETGLVDEPTTDSRR